MSEPNPSLRAIYPKSKERAARIALIVHCINAVVEGRVPDQIIPRHLLEAAIAFTGWSIGQTRLIYADAGVVSHENTSKIVRFVERFRNGGWVTARDVTHWWSAKPKPNAETARTFMKQVVDLGHAIDNGAIGRTYAIQIKNIDNTDNNHSQNPAPSDSKHGNSSGNESVTVDNNTTTAFKEHPFELDNDSNGLHGGFSTSVTTDYVLPEINDSRDFNGSSVDLLPDVTSVVTIPKIAPGEESTGICYPVTDTRLQAGDRIVLTGEGTSRPSDELDAIWTVRTLQGQKVVIDCEALGHRVFPMEWLTLYERVTKQA